MQHEHSSGAVLFKTENGSRVYLLVKEKKGHFGIPKGHLEAGETEFQAAMREIWEETGLKPKMIEGFKAESHYVTPMGNPKLVSYFLGCYDGMTPICTDEVAGILELTYSDAMEKLTHQASKDILFEAEKYISENLE